MSKWIVFGCFIGLLPSYVIYNCVGYIIIIIIDLVNSVNMKSTACEVFQENYFKIFSVNIWFDSILLSGEVINVIIWVFFIVIICKYVIDKWDNIPPLKTENETLQTKLTEKKLEIANLQRQLNNSRTEGGARAVPPPPPSTEQGSETSSLLPGSKSLVYQAVQYATFPVIDN